MSGVHGQLATTMVLYYCVLGLWGLVFVLRQREIDASYRGALVLAECLAILQIVVGGILLFIGGGNSPRQDSHYLYGVSAVVTLPLVHVFLAGRLPPALAYALGCFFMFGLAIRGIVTAG